MQPYQVMPDLSEEEFAALKGDIALRGVLVPVEKDEHGNILDGHHRVRACEELGISDYPTIIRAGMNEADKRLHAEVLNTFRRQLSREDRAERIIRLRARGWSYRRIAEVAGVDEKTVRNRVTSGAENSAPDLPARTVGKDGKVYPAHRPTSVTAVTKRQEAAALSIFEKTPDVLGTESAAQEDLTLADLRKAEKQVHRARLDAITETPPAPEVYYEVRPGSWWRLGRHLLYCGDTSSPEFIERAPSCPFAFADPPYNVEKAAWDSGFIWRHDWLCDAAEVVAVTPGISEFARFLRLTQMPYSWAFTGWIKNGMTRGAMGFGNTLLSLLFSNGSLHRNAQDFMSLTVEVAATGETLHPSRKPARFVAHLMEVFSHEGDSVIDPFLGSGTTLFVAEQMNRSAFVGEIAPNYCSEVIGRWERLTGAEAIEVAP